MGKKVLQPDIPAALTGIANLLNPAHGSPAVRRANSFSSLLIGVLILWAVLDAAGRFGPIAWLHTIPELVAARHSGLDSPFAPDSSIREDHWIGETTVTGNLPPEESRAPIVFSTDELGFRRTPNLPATSRLDYLLTGGSSFAYGGGLSDDETFPAALTRDEHLSTYNGGRYFWDVPHFVYVERLLHRLQPRKPSAAVYLYWENLNPTLDLRQLDPLPWAVDRPGRMILGSPRYSELRACFQNRTDKTLAAVSVSPLEVLSIRFFKMFADGRALPNPYASAVTSRVLPNGQRMLFLDAEVERVRTPLSDQVVRQQGEYFQEYARRLAAQGLNLYVILLPNKYSLYGPLVDGNLAVSPHPFLERVEAELSSRHIAVLNGFKVLQPYAASDIASGDLAYYRDDHHWTPKGVRRIAAAFAGFVRSR